MHEDNRSIMDTQEPDRIWEEESLMDGKPYRLEMWYLGTYPLEWGRVRVGYRFHHGEELIFEGDEYSPSPSMVFDGDESVAGLLGFFGVRPGDTDPEYFEDYTERQLEWVARHADTLLWYEEELEIKAAGIVTNYPR